MPWDRSGEDSPQDYDDEADRMKQKITDLETEIERLRAAGKHMEQLYTGALKDAERDLLERDRLREAARSIRETCAVIAETWRSPHGGPRDLEVAQAIAKSIRDYEQQMREGKDAAT